MPIRQAYLAVSVLEATGVYADSRDFLGHRSGIADTSLFELRPDGAWLGTTLAVHLGNKQIIPSQESMALFGVVKNDNSLAVWNCIAKLGTKDLNNGLDAETLDKVADEIFLSQFIHERGKSKPITTYGKYNAVVYLEYESEPHDARADSEVHLLKAQFGGTESISSYSVVDNLVISHIPGSMHIDSLFIHKPSKGFLEMQARTKLDDTVSLPILVLEFLQFALLAKLMKENCLELTRMLHSWEQFIVPSERLTFHGSQRDYVNQILPLRHSSLKLSAHSTKLVKAATSYLQDSRLSYLHQNDQITNVSLNSVYFVHSPAYRVVNNLKSTKQELETASAELRSTSDWFSDFLRDRANMEIANTNFAIQKVVTRLTRITVLIGIVSILIAIGALTKDSIGTPWLSQIIQKVRVQSAFSDRLQSDNNQGNHVFFGVSKRQFGH